MCIGSFPCHSFWFGFAQMRRELTDTIQGLALASLLVKLNLVFHVSPPFDTYWNKISTVEPSFFFGNLINGTLPVIHQSP